ncbi:hypothetical protein [Micromonospora psammae]|uniref:hypothetical protein n=1 Tax=Micromonospora sp. CPCC 205556 TaxID=3122398 RepID=UPI002FF19A15
MSQLMFRVDEVFDLPARQGLVVCGTMLAGSLQGVPDFVDELSGERLRVLGVDFPTPRTRRTGQQLLVVAREDAALVAPGRVWTAPSTPDA